MDRVGGDLYDLDLDDEAVDDDEVEETARDLDLDLEYDVLLFRVGCRLSGDLDTNRRPLDLDLDLDLVLDLVR